MALILFNLKHKIRLVLESIIIVLFAIYTFALSYHHAFFGTLFSFFKLSVANELNGVINEIFVKLEPNYFFFLLVVIIWFIFVFLYSKFHSFKDYKLSKKLSVLKLVFSIIFATISLITYNNQFITTETDEAKLIQSDEYLYQTMSNKNRFLTRFGYLSYFYRDLELIINHQAENLSEQDKLWIENYINEHQLSENDMTGIYKDKNLILILAESFCPQVINEELTPTLSKLKNEGFYFENFYAPIYQSATCDSEFIALTSMIPSIDYGTTSKAFANNSYPYALANLFSMDGYSANSYHSFIKSFYNREPLHNSLGFSFYYDREDLSIYLEPYHEDYYNWVDDGDLFTKTIEHTDTDSKFFDFIITSSGHMPYADLREELYENYDIAQDYFGEINPEILYYYASQMKLDQGLNELLDSLEDNNVLEDTIIVIFGDHYPYGISDEESYDFLFGELDNEYDIYKVPFMIYDPSDDSRQIVSKLGSTFDIYPTIVNLFGLNDYSRGAFISGIDLFSDAKSSVKFMDGSFLTDNYFYDAQLNSSTYFDQQYSNTEEIIDYQNLLDYSQKLLSSDYFK